MPATVYTADSVKAEQVAAEYRTCRARSEAPCEVPDCAMCHCQWCSRAEGHPMDVHIALGFSPAGPEITSVWIAVNEGASDGSEG